MSGDGSVPLTNTTALAINHGQGSSKPQGQAQRLAILDRLDKVKTVSTGFQALCPVHDDRNPSLVVDVDDGRVLLYCHGCGANGSDVCRKLRLDPGTFPFTDPTVSREGFEVARYRYDDLHGSALYDVVRFADKRFALRLPDAVSGGVGEVPRVLYRLPEVAKAVEEGERVVIVEGEKDADRLAALGFAATTSPMGAGKWARCNSTMLDGAVTSVSHVVRALRSVGLINRSRHPYY